MFKIDHGYPNATERARTDPRYHALVSSLYQLIAGGDFTPTELREALILAATEYEMKRIRLEVFSKVIREDNKNG